MTRLRRAKNKAEYTAYEAYAWVLLGLASKAVRSASIKVVGGRSNNLLKREVASIGGHVLAVVAAKGWFAARDKLHSRKLEAESQASLLAGAIAAAERSRTKLARADEKAARTAIELQECHATIRELSRQVRGGPQREKAKAGEPESGAAMTDGTQPEPPKLAAPISKTT